MLFLLPVIVVLEFKIHDNVSLYHPLRYTATILKLKYRKTAA